MTGIVNADDLTQAFTFHWGRRDAVALAALFLPDGDMQTLTGLWAEGRDAIDAALTAEFAGTFARARLVTGRLKRRDVAPGVVFLMQRYVLSGLVHADGSDAGRIGAVLTLLAVERPGGWQVAAAQFTAEG